MSSQKYKNIGKKQIIDVVSQLIQKLDALEMTVSMLIMFVDKDDKFNDYVKEKLGELNESSTDEGDNIGGDTASGNENA
jgi:hypothetical protein